MNGLDGYAWDSFDCFKRSKISLGREVTISPCMQSKSHREKFWRMLTLFDHRQPVCSSSTGI